MMTASARKRDDSDSNRPRVQFSDYIVYGDESGDHGLERMDPSYPVFVLTFCIFRKDEYSAVASPEIQRFKFRHFGHDMTILHEADIRKARSHFEFMTNQARRDWFLRDLTATIEKIPFTIIASAIRKDELHAKYANKSRSPYDLALKFCLERLSRFLADRNQASQRAHIVVERRGKREDNDLELEFRRICGGQNYRKIQLPFELVFGDKKCNSTGMQIADLVARPIGRHVLDNAQPNRTWPIIQAKLHTNRRGIWEGVGLKRFP